MVQQQYTRELLAEHLVEYIMQDNDTPQRDGRRLRRRTSSTRHRRASQRIKQTVGVKPKVKEEEDDKRPTTTTMVADSVVADVPDSLASLAAADDEAPFPDAAPLSSSSDDNNKNNGAVAVRIKHDYSPDAAVLPLSTLSFSNETTAVVVVEQERRFDHDDDDDDATPDDAPSSSSDPPLHKKKKIIIKDEMEAYNLQMTQRASLYQRYADRYLLHRHDGRGIARLGGNLQNTYIFPALKNKYIWNPRDQHQLRPEYPLPLHLMGVNDETAQVQNGRNTPPHLMRDFTYLTYNGVWNPYAPQFAGQPTAAVSGVPEYVRDSGHAFPIFVSRSRTHKHQATMGKALGWEYVGNYKVTTDTVPSYESHHNFSVACKRTIAEGFWHSSQSQDPDSYGSQGLGYWRNVLTDALATDDSPAAPSLPGQPEPSLAARARALGFDPITTTDKELAFLMVELHEFYHLTTIQFVVYDERIYEYCVGGKTSKDAQGNMRASSGQPPAKAGDWYQFAEENMLMM